MSQYVLKSDIKAEIEKLKSVYLSIFSKGETEESCYEAISCISICNKILSLIDNIEVKEVDLEKELKKKIGNVGECDRRLAEYFFELGLKAKE